ncbi:85 kD calcium-independent phospholipase A2 (ipla2), putative [Schistosoma mansoni]|uniref:85 kD calcium-independent phospholipase A2 (ipla2), putative n=1 Tax=Schistosoma mansoni TaxID=6183 RepID=UPI00022C860E|nr:85 kD calcium-independent phospholipase A2 (ipla2), putative [Schistosoma mansoni]|eukprot:XP_018644152.1 85 kD calcium-independent phospholipase A2 (ipla2), putative [Schistosoma mansoni]
MNDMLNERYILSDGSDVIAMSDMNSSVGMRNRKAHHPKYFNVTEALHVIEVGLSDDAVSCLTDCKDYISLCGC